MNIDDLIATAQPRTQEVPICARGDLVAAHEEAVRAYQAALKADDSLAGNPASVDAAEAVTAIEAAIEAATVTIVVRSVSRDAWADLLRDHPPSKEERRAGHDYNPKTFPPAAVAACTDLTLEQSQALASEREDGTPVLPPGEWAKLWTATFMLNVTETPRPKLAAATDLLRASGRSSTTSVPEASPVDGSLAGSGAR